MLQIYLIVVIINFLHEYLGLYAIFFSLIASTKFEQTSIWHYLKLVFDLSNPS